jgi:hypothetical protein
MLKAAQSIIKDKLGVVASRIFQLLLTHKQLEEAQACLVRPPARPPVSQRPLASVRVTPGAR